MSNNKIANLANPTANKDAVSRVYGDGRYVKKSGDTMTGNLALGGNYITGWKSKLTDYATNKPDLQQKIIEWKNAKWEDRTDNIFYKAYEQWITYDGFVQLLDLAYFFHLLVSVILPGSFSGLEWGL